MKRILVKLLLVVSAVIIVSGCENDYPDSIYNADESFKPNPVITNISPESAFAGVDTLDIIGENFSSDASDITIYFNGQLGEVISATPTLIRVVPANIIGDSIKIQLNVKGALNFANYNSYKLEPIIINYGSFTEFDDIYGIECDKDENVYVSLRGKKIEKITQDLERSEYVTNLLLEKTSQILFGPEGELYYLNGVRFLVKIDPNGGDDGLFATLPGNAWDMDFDANQNIYAGGSGSAVYKITLDKVVSTVKEYPDVNIKAIRVFDNYVYVAGKYSGSDANTPLNGVWRNQILEGSETLGETEVVFDFDANFPGFEIESLEFAEDGDMYLGTTAPEAIIVVHPGGNFEALYPGVLSPSIYAMVWGNGPFLYMTTKEVIKKDDGTEKEVSNVLRVNMRKNSAPYFGRN